MKLTNQKFDAALLIGVPSIDQEHIELARRLEELAGDEQEITQSERFSEALSGLGSQIDTHFNNEEQFFKRLGMPDDVVSSHVQAHTAIIAQYVQLNLDIMLGKAPDHARILHMIKGWIIGHIVDHDLKIRDHLVGMRQTIAG